MKLLAMQPEAVCVDELLPALLAVVLHVLVWVLRALMQSHGLGAAADKAAVLAHRFFCKRAII
jgi:hypothetical protein